MSQMIIKSEDFSALSSYTSTAFGSNLSSFGGISCKRRLVGPILNADTTAPGYSLELAASSNSQPGINATGGATTFALGTADYFINSLNLDSNGLYLAQMYDNTGGGNRCVALVARNNGNFWTYGYGGPGNVDTGIPIIYNKWFSIYIAFQSTNPYTAKFYLQTAGAAPVLIATVSGSSYGSAVKTWYAGAVAGGGTNTMTGRIGAMQLIAISSFADVAVPGNYAAPPSTPQQWYLNPTTGNDANDGGTAATAIQTIAEFNTRSQYAGFLGRAAPAQITASSLTMAGGVATVNATAHGLSVGQTFAIAGASPPWLNSGGMISCVSANSFCFLPLFVPTPYAGAGGSALTATGTIKIAPFAAGDVVNIDTSAAPLDIGSAQMLLATRGLRLQPIAGQSIVAIKAWKDVSGTTAGGSTTWTQYNAGTYPNVWQTTDGGAADLTGIVVWENDKWMNHPTGSTIAAVAATMNTNAGGVGQFYSDGTTIYLVASDSSNPNTNGKTYTRSRFRSSNGASAVYANVLDQQIVGLQVSKTCLANPTSNDPYIAYGIQGDGSFGGTARISNCTVAYASKHGIGLTENVSATEIVLIDGNDCEQGSAYSGPGGQTLFVSYTSLGSGTLGSGATHNYANNTALKTAGLVGSSAGTNPTNVGTFLTHNNGGVNQFLALNFMGCNFGGGVGALGSMQAMNVVDSMVGGVSGSSSPGGTINVDRCLSTALPFISSLSLQVTNSIYAPTITFGGTLQGATAVSGSNTWQGCTIDLRNVAISDTANQGMLYRNGALSLTIEDCVIITNGATNGATLLQNATSADTIVMDHNAYQAGASTPIFLGYNDGSTTASRTLTQLQTLGIEKSSSIIATALGLSATYVPRKGSPVIRAGVALAALNGTNDYVGAPRPSSVAPDIGAVQYVAQPAGSLGLSQAFAMGFDELETV